MGFAPLLVAAALALGAPCQARVDTGVLPVWARAGFSDPKPRMPHVLGAHGRIAAILFGYPLASPPAQDHANKILWVSRRTPTRGSSLRIAAQRWENGRPAGPPVARRVDGGPGPSIVDLPAAGCWRLTLRWSGRLDVLDLDFGTP
jgi:hypothetical protein